MKQLSIGNGAMTASNLALGCMRIPRVPREDADRLLKTALELGIDFFDHADVYGGGNSEKLFGELMNLRSDLRGRIKIQSKCTLVRNEVETIYNDQTKQYILDSVDGSLRRLNTDYLDCYLLHAPDTLVEPEEVAEAFDILLANGKVRSFGVSNHKPLQIELLQRSLKQKLIVNQMQLSAAHTDLIDASQTIPLVKEGSVDIHADTFTYCRLHGLTIQAWSPFQHGFYGGVYMGDPGYPELNRVTDRLAAEKGVSASAIAVAWLLRHPARIQPLIGTTNAERLRDICTANDIELSRAEWYEMYRASLADEGKIRTGNSNAKPAK